VCGAAPSSRNSTAGTNPIGCTAQTTWSMNPITSAGSCSRDSGWYCDPARRNIVALITNGKMT
jgi:hypothetical protein